MEDKKKAGLICLSTLELENKYPIPPKKIATRDREKWNELCKKFQLELYVLYDAQAPDSKIPLRPVSFFLKHPLFRIIIPHLEVKSNSISMEMFIETALLLNNYNAGIYPMKWDKRLEFDGEDILLLTCLTELLSLYNRWGGSADMECLRDTPLLDDCDLSNLKYEKLYLNEAIYKLRLEKKHEVGIENITHDDVAKMYKDIYTNEHPYQSLYIQVLKGKSWAAIMAEMLLKCKGNSNETDDEVNKKNTIRPGAPKKDFTCCFETQDVQKQELYIQELEKLCKGAKGTQVALVMLVAKTVGILTNTPSHNTIVETFGTIGHQSIYYSQLKKIKEDTPEWMKMKAYMENIKEKVESGENRTTDRNK